MNRKEDNNRIDDIEFLNENQENNEEIYIAKRLKIDDRYFKPLFYCYATLHFSKFHFIFVVIQLTYSAKYSKTLELLLIVKI